MHTTRPPAPPEAPTGEVHFGDYVLLDRLAVGGMAEVFRAKQISKKRTVVLKRMLPHIAASSNAKSMFRAEAEFGRLVTHPNVVKVIDFGDWDGQPFIALEYVHGTDLFRLMQWAVRTGNGLDQDTALYIARALLAGLHTVHETCGDDGRALDIVHRDVSPSNILMSDRGEVRLGDFGIAYACLRENFALAPLSARAKGKLGYLAPEQVLGQPCDRRADVFSAAVVLAELLMGKPLFRGNSELAVLLAIRDGEIGGFLHHARDRLSPELGDAVCRALSPNPEDRFHTAADFSEAIVCGERADAASVAAHLGDLVGIAMGPRHPRSDGRGPEAHLVSFSESPPPLLADADSNVATPVVPRVALEAAARRFRRKEGDTEPDWPSQESDGDEEPQTPEGPITSEQEAALYYLQRQDGGHEGPWSYARAVEAVALGEVQDDDLIRIDGIDREAMPVKAVPELARHLPTGTRTPSANEPTGLNPEFSVPMDGGHFLRALADCTVKKRTGMWLCEHGVVRKELYVQDGAPTFVSSNLAEELLGEYLVNQRVISRSELDMALAVIHKFDGKLGETLTALGLVEPVHLFRHIAGQVKEKLLDLFVWVQGTAAFHPDILPPQSRFALGLNPWKLYFQGMLRRVADGMEAPLIGEDGAAANGERLLVRTARIGGEEVNGEVLPVVANVYSWLTSPLTAQALWDRMLSQGHVGDEGAAAVAFLVHTGLTEWVD